MPAIVITDETAAAQRISVDQTRKFNLGSGAGINRLTVAGVDVAGAGGVMSNLTIDSSGASPTQGSISVSAGGSATVTTTPASRPPVVALTRSRVSRLRSTADGNPLHCGNANQSDPLFEIDSLVNGGFDIVNNDAWNAPCSAPAASTASYSYI